MRQLPLDLASPPRFGRSDYLASPTNAAALHAIASWPDWPDPMLILVGPMGAGKSHLAAIWAERARALVLRPGDDLALHRLDPVAARAVLIEDADRRDGQETALFHLINLVREARSFLLLTARDAPDAWGVRIPDLLSRLRLAPTVRVGAPDEGLLRAVLCKLFTDRQLVVDDAVIAYLVLRLNRSIGEARTVVDALDRTGLALNRRVTRALAAMVLDELDRSDDG